MTVVGLPRWRWTAGFTTRRRSSRTAGSAASCPSATRPTTASFTAFAISRPAAAGLDPPAGRGRALWRRHAVCEDMPEMCVAVEGVRGPVGAGAQRRPRAGRRALVICNPSASDETVGKDACRALLPQPVGQAGRRVPVRRRRAGQILHRHGLRGAQPHRRKRGAAGPVEAL